MCYYDYGELGMLAVDTFPRGMMEAADVADHSIRSILQRNAPTQLNKRYYFRVPTRLKMCN